MTKAITVNEKPINIIETENGYYICLTDMVKGVKDGDHLIRNWLQNKNTIEFLGVWEQLNNSNFKLVEFYQIKFDAGVNNFLMSVKQWVEKTSAIGIKAKTGRNGGTYAYYDIALEFAAWYDPTFKLYIINEFQKFKALQSEHQNPEWIMHREFAKINYTLQTDAVKNNLIPPTVTRQESRMIYADEAELVNKAVLGQTSKDWRTTNPALDGNIRDHSSSVQLKVLGNMESYNSILIGQHKSKEERIVEINREAQRQFAVLIDTKNLKQLNAKSA